MTALTPRVRSPAEPAADKPVPDAAAESFRRIIEDNPFGIYVADARFRIRHASRDARRAFASVPGELIGCRLDVALRTLWREPFASEAIARFRHTLETGEPFATERTVHERADTGLVEAYDWRIERITLPDGAFGVVCYYYDLTARHRLELHEREQAERARRRAQRDAFLLALEERLRALWDPDEIPHAAACLLGRHLGLHRVGWAEDVGDGEALDIHRQFLDGVGDLRGRYRYASFPHEDMAALRAGRTLARSDLPADPRFTPEQQAAIARHALGATIDVPLLKDGRLLAILFAHSRTPRAWSPEDIELTEAVAHRLWEALERARAHKALSYSEARFRRIFEHAGMGIALTDLEGRFRDCNAAYAAMLGYSRAELLRMQFDQLIHPADAARHRACAERLLAGEIDDFGIECRYLRKDRATVWIRKSVVMVPGVDGRPASIMGLVTDITEEHAAREQLAERRRRFESLANAMPQLVWVSGGDGTVQFMNEGWQAYTGWSAEELARPEGWTQAVHPEDAPRAQSAWRQALEQRKAYEAEIRLRRRDGAYRWFLARAVPQRDPSGGIERWYGTCTDVEAAKQAEQRLREQESALREADQRKDQFLATLSHELRNPLAPIRAAAALLASPRLGPEQLRRVQQMITRQVQHMGWLLDDLLDVARITRGKLTLRLEHVMLADVVETAVETARPSIERKGHALEVRLPAEPVGLIVDPLRISQVVANLLTNAAKYTDPGGHIRLVAELAGAELRITVADDGLGIDPAALPKLFTMFTQLQSDGIHSEGGLGIGLALARALTELHGGRIAASSAGPGRGSQFTVCLPLAELTRARSDAAAGQACGAAAPLRILIADDNADAAESLGMLLQLEGHEVQIATGGRAALATAERFDPQVALLDLGMPDLDGCAVARALRESGRPELTLVAVTGWGRDEHRERSRAAGFDVHLTKPIDPATLSTVLAKVGPGAGPSGEVAPCA